MLTRALQLHVSEPGLWSYAAAWEFDHNGNAAAARMLMQRGLRMRPDSQQLWLEYFKLELHYAQKLVARRKVLGIDSPAPAQPTAAVTAAAQQQAAVVGEGGSEAMSMDGATAEQQPDTQAAVAADQDAAAEQLAAVQQQGVLEMDARQDPAAVSELISGSQPGSEGPSLASAGPGPSAADEAVQAVLGGAIAKVSSICFDLGWRAPCSAGLPLQRLYHLVPVPLFEPAKPVACRWQCPVQCASTGHLHSVGQPHHSALVQP